MRVRLVMNTIVPVGAVLARALRRASCCPPSAVGCWLVLAILTGPPATASEERHVDAVEVFHCTFDRNWDINYDAWPDRWVRRTGPDYPHYVNIEIRDDPTAVAGRCLTAVLDGAAAAFTSPPIRVLSRFSYKLEARLKAEGLEHSRVRIKVEFFDENGELLDEFASQDYQNTDGWTKVHLGPLTLQHDNIDRAVVGLEVVPGRRSDLEGVVSLDDVWLARLPRMTVSTDSPFNVYTDPSKVIITCELSGIRERDPEIRFQLFDASNRQINDDSFQLDGRLIVEGSRKATDIVDGQGSKPAGYEVSTHWQPPIPDYGFYRVVVKMLSSADAAGDQSEGRREVNRREVQLVVLPPLPAPENGEFGWTLPDGDHPLAFDELIHLLPQVGINWVKLPVWFSKNDLGRGDAIIHFAERLASSDIEVVGMIDSPPAEPAIPQQITRADSIADLFSLDPSDWQPLLDPVMTRLALRVRWWQLGSDQDDSFTPPYPDLRRKIAELRKQLYRFGQEVNLGLVWKWQARDAEAGPVPWDFQLYSATPTQWAENLAHHLEEPHANSGKRWLQIEPISKHQTSRGTPVPTVETRVHELVCQMVTAKAHDVDAVFLPRPFDDEVGLMQADGSPGELLLPWRTASCMLGGAEYLGELQLPAGSENRVFLRRDGQVVMVLWNSQVTEEVDYLGDEVQRIDCWGLSSTPPERGRRQVIEVGPLPVYVLGLHEKIARWRMATQFDSQHVPSVYRFDHPNGIQGKNFFDQGVGGRLRVVVLHDVRTSAAGSLTGIAEGEIDDRWTIEPSSGEFALVAGQSLHFPLNIVLKGASYGMQPVRIDFVVDADQRYEFSVYRNLHVGLGDIQIELSSHLEEDGTLVVVQKMTNSGDKVVDFKCYLYAGQDHRRQRTQVYRLGTNVDRKIYRYANGEALIGSEMLLEVEEVGTKRVFKHPFIATK